MPRDSAAGFLAAAWERILIVDGGMGTSLAASGLAEKDFGGHPGCNEYLVRSAPDAVRRVHKSFLDAGADIIETDTFGGARHVLAEHGLADDCFELNREAAALARAAADRFSTADRPRFVAGSIGPGSLLPSLGSVGFADLVASHLPQVLGLAAGRADCLMVETVQDLLQARAVLEAVRRAETDLPVIVQFTLDEHGRTLTGSDITALLAAFESLPVVAIGLNCGTGPGPMNEPLRYLAGHSSRLLSVLPNAGLPREQDGRLFYDLPPHRFAVLMRSHAEDPGLNIAGGCCGTTAEHIRALSLALEGIPPRPAAKPVPRLGSMYSSQDIDIRPKPLIVGERTNASGSRKFRALLLAGDFDAMAAAAREQEEEGAHVIDLSVAAPGRDETADMARIAALLNRSCRIPVMVDSTSPAAVEAALERLGGRCVVNSASLQEGESRAAALVELCARHGAALVCLTIDEQGMAMTGDRKLKVARRLYRLALDRGLAPSALFFDFLTFTLASGDPALRRSAAETLSALERARDELPGSFTLLGVSNVSHGLPPRARRYLNSVFLHHAIERGLDAAIMHAGKVLPLHLIPVDAVRLCEALVFDRRAAAASPLDELLARFSKPAPAETAARTAGRAVAPPEERLRGCVLAGDPGPVPALLDELGRTLSPLEIVDRVLLPAMERVGELFETGDMLLPFVLRSAEVVRAALDLVRPRLGAEPAPTRRTVVLATVRGDIHDIGKNLVAMILEANGYRVVDLGVRQPASEVLAAVRQYRPDAVGLSGLLVESARAMKEYLQVFSAAGVSIPVLCGGAALTRKFVGQELQPAYPGPVFFCRTAMDGLKAMREIAARR